MFRNRKFVCRFSGSVETQYVVLFLQCRAASEHTLGVCRPPYSVETPYDKTEDFGDVSHTSFQLPLGTTELSHRGSKEEQFAWWSKHWSSTINQEQRPPIKPVEKIWLGNFQRALVSARKEQLGSFPAYKDFNWPPPEDVERVGQRCVV